MVDPVPEAVAVAVDIGVVRDAVAVEVVGRRGPRIAWDLRRASADVAGLVGAVVLAVQQAIVVTVCVCVVGDPVAVTIAGRRSPWRRGRTARWRDRATADGAVYVRAVVLAIGEAVPVTVIGRRGTGRRSARGWASGIAARRVRAAVLAVGDAVAVTITG